MRISVLAGARNDAPITRQTLTTLEALRLQGHPLDYACAICDADDVPAVAASKENDAILVLPGAADARQIEKLAMLSGLFAAVHAFSAPAACAHLAPLKTSRERAFDITVVSDPYQGLSGAPHGVVAQSYELVGADTLRYTETNIRLLAQVALEAAQPRSRRLTSVDQADRLGTMELWRDVVAEAVGRHPDVSVEHRLIEQAIAQLVADPYRFDTIVAGGNLGAILAAQIGALTGTPGVWARALVGSGGFGIYEIASSHHADTAPDVPFETCAPAVLNALSLMFRYSGNDPQLEAHGASTRTHAIQEHQPSQR
jgi:3-isopropylmalate dehydrogenase